MNRLGMRQHIILWYAALFALTAWAIASLCFHAAVDFIEAQTDEHVIRAAVILADRIDVSQGRVTFNLPDEDQKQLARDVRYAFHTQDGVLTDGKYEPWMDAYPRDFNAVRHIERDGQDYWFLRDKAVLRDGNQIGWLRVLLASNLYDASLRTFEFLWVGILVVSLILAVLGGMVISGRALKPLKDITRTAREIGAGDLTKRLALKGSRDEVGELARAFNEMADSLEQAFAREKQLTSDVSHELRTPLAVITAHAENAEQEDNLDAYRCANAAVLQKSRQLQRMISQILMFAREHEHENTMQLEEVDLRRALLDLADEAAEWAEGKNITVETDVPDDLMIQADQMLLTRLFLNLLDNAVKYGREGGRIKVKALRAGDMAVVSVCDNGDGIAAEDLPHIFKRFYRADKARSGAGAGLGLSFAEMIVRLHRGKISARSTPGVETCFVVELPFARKQ